jgi:FkbM family methyltransferase
MNLAGLQLKLVSGSYFLVKRSGLLDRRWGRRLFLRSYFLYKRHLEDSFYHLIRRHPKLFLGGHVIDVGANVGYTAALFARAVDSEFRVYAFEPEAFNFALFSEMLDSFPLRDRVVPVQAAVGEKDGTVDLALNESHPADHRIATKTFRNSDAAPGRFLQVPLRSVDSFVNEAFPVCFIKIDVQGYEPPVCWGMERTLAANPNCTVVLEYTPGSLAALGFNAAELLNWFAARDYRVHTVHHDGTLSPGTPEVLGANGYADLLFSRRDLSGYG